MLRFLGAIAAFLVAGIFCEIAIVQFQLYDIASNKPYNLQWEATSPAPQELEHIGHCLDQPFYYFGSGRNSYTFISRDNTTILKFFKQYDWQSAWLVHTPRKLDNVFSSCKIAYEKLKEETGVFCLHLNKTEKTYGKVILEDNLGFSHSVDLDASQFVMQKHAKPIFSKITKEIRRGDYSGAEKGISETLDVLESICKKGIKIASPPKRKNFGFVDNRVIGLDIDSFSMTSFSFKKEFKENTKYFRRWLKKYHPELYNYYNIEMSKRTTLI